MRRGKQIILTIMITLALLALAWSAGTGSSQERTIGVIAAKSDIPAGSQLSADQLTMVQLPESLAADIYLTDLSAAVGQWTFSTLSDGELLSRTRLARTASGISYPEPGPGRRLITIDLEPADAVGFWLAAGSVVDVYLIPRSQQSVNDIKILEKVRVMGIVSPVSGSLNSGLPAENGQADGLICLDVNNEQARLIISSRTACDITLAAINEVVAPASSAEVP